MSNAQQRYWILTIPYYAFTPYLPPNCCYIIGQLEAGTNSKTRTTSVDRNDQCDDPTYNLSTTGSPIPNLCFERSSQVGTVPTGMGRVTGDQGVLEGPVDNSTTGVPYYHWQIVVCFKRKLRLGGVRSTFGPFHAESTRSSAANAYVWKDETAVAGTRFELGSLPVQRSNSHDWEAIRGAATSGQLDDIPGDIFVRYYGNLRRIAVDHSAPIAIERKVFVFWGPTGVGKSRRAWEEAGLTAYPKDPRSKFWDGYRGQEHVVIDEFRGDIDIGHVLRWFDRYPVIVEVKGSAQVLRATTYWITSNTPPEEWYRNVPNINQATIDALFRRLIITAFE